MRILSLPFAALLCTAAGAVAQDVPITAGHWSLTGDAAMVSHQGQAALRVGDGTARLTGPGFTTGVVEFDVMLDPARAFPGLLFRCRDDDNCENIYFRPHMSGRPDAAQYAPFVNGITSWQIFSGEAFNAQAAFRFGEWMHVRVDVYRDSASVSLDGRQLMRIPDLKGSEREGFVGFSSSEGRALFANVRVTPIADREDPDAPAQPPPLPPGTVIDWQVSEAIDEAEAMRRARAGDWSRLAWAARPPETNGIVYLARSSVWNRARPTVIARFDVDSAESGDVPMRFGFSDRVAVFVNGRLTYEGNDAQATRDYRFLGSVGFYDTLILPLRAGRNQVAFVVTEGGGGWAAAARLVRTPAPAEGVR